LESAFRNPVLSGELPGNSGVRMLTLYSRALQRRGDVTLYLPSGVGDHQLPLLILLHGVYGSHWNWWALGNLPDTAAEMTASGEIVPFAIAMPSDGLWGDGSGYLRHKHIDTERWIIDDLPACVHEFFPQIRIDKLCLAGLSMGGFGALRIGAKYASRVIGISAHSAITSLADLNRYVEGPIENDLASGRRDTSLLYWMQRNRTHLQPIRFDCGTEDPLLESNRTLHQALVKARIPHSYEERPGGHDWVYWQQHVRSTLRFVSEQMRQRT
jgi:putative tributyrin esterase